MIYVKIGSYVHPLFPQNFPVTVCGKILEENIEALSPVEVLALTDPGSPDMLCYDCARGLAWLESEMRLHA
jgi:hypothetical protein